MPTFYRSLAAMRYRADATAINSHLWVARLAEGGLKASLKPLEPTADPVAELGLPAYYKDKLGHSVNDLQVRTLVSSRWRRLLTLVMLTSAFERYLTAVAQTAVASDPALTAGFPKLVDGAQLRKHGVRLKRPDLTGLVVGQWSQRLASYGTLFGRVPEGLRKVEPELEFLRKSRNRVAHALGVDDGYDNSSDGVGQDSGLDKALGWRRPTMLPQVQISDERILKLLNIVQSSVDSVDAHLLPDYIGDFDLIDLYVEWHADPDAFEARAGIEANPAKSKPHARFRKVQGALFGTTAGSHYVLGLEKYVKEL